MLLARIAHFVQGYRGIILAGGELLSVRAFVAIVPRLTSATPIGYRVAWA